MIDTLLTNNAGHPVNIPEDGRSRLRSGGS